MPMYIGAWQKDGKQTTYPITSGSMGASDAIPMLSESLSDAVETSDNNVLSNKAGRRYADITARNFKGGLSCQLRYNDLGKLLAMGFGFENPNTSGATYHGSPESVSGHYLHIFERDDNLQTEGWLAGEMRYPLTTWYAGDCKVRRGCIGLYKQVSDWRYNSVMINKMTFTFEPKLCKVDFDVIPHSRDRGSYASGTWTFELADSMNVIFPSLAFAINGTSYGISRATVVIDNKLLAQRDTASGLYILEPKRTENSTVEFGFDFLRDDAEAFFNTFDAGTEFYASIVSSYSTYLMGLYFNSCKIETIDRPISGPGILSTKHQAIAYMPSTNNFGSVLSNIVLIKSAEVFCALVDDHSTNYLVEV
jgi:hypothetical protein